MESLLVELTEWATTLEDPLLRTRAMTITKEVFHGGEVRRCIVAVVPSV